MKKVAIFMSDFHLGQQDRMEEFHADNEFAELIGRLSWEHADNEVDLVLLGDVIDLWTTTIDPKEVNAQTVADVGLYLPSDKGGLGTALQKEKVKVEAICQAHSLFFEALGRFLVRNPSRRRIVYVPGNHDHSVVHKDLQEQIRRTILQKTQGDSSLLQDRIVFPSWYGDESLQVYAEHGNQLTFGGIFRYEDFETFGVECPGYVQFKLVSNRLERCSPELDSVFMESLEPSMWPGVFWWLVVKGNFRALRAARMFKLQYEQDTSWRVQWARKRLPPSWKTFVNLAWNRYFGLTQDEYSKQLPKLFDETSQDVVPLSGRWLDPSKIKTIILGHTHQARAGVDLPGLEGVKYYNTGSWIYRYENGRRVVEQTWVTISTELHADRERNNHHIIDRHMSRRRVELLDPDSNPISSEGHALNAVMREMPDLRVGDVLLFRWNFGATLWRLFSSRRVRDKLEILRVIPEMIISWFNRSGTFSYWSHAALIYGSPSEEREAEAYNDPLILESLPGTGVGIHGPNHYLAYRKDWNMAILRPKAAWLSDLLHGWPNRLLLRRLANSSLQAHYDNQVVRRLTISYAGRTMDKRGRAVVGGLVKGAIAGVLVSFSWIVLVVVFNLNEAHRLQHGWSGLWSETTGVVKTTWHQLPTQLQLSHLIPFPWESTITPLTTSSSIALKFFGVGLEIALFIILMAAAISLIGALGRIWLGVSVAYGAGWGAFMVPLMGDLSGGWNKLSELKRWVITGAWLLVPFLTLLSMFIFLPFIKTRDSTIVVLELIAVLMILATVCVVTLLLPFINLAAFLITRPCGWLLGSVRAPFNARRGSTLKKRLETQFLCSSFVHYALLQAADRVNGAKRSDIQVCEKWEQTLPKDFARSEKFQWIYLLIDGEIVHEPSASHRAEVESDTTDDAKSELSRWAAWSFRCGVLALGFLFLADVEKTLVILNDHWFGVGLGSTVLLGSLAFVCSRTAECQFAKNPLGLRGETLAFWGKFLGTLALLLAVLVVGSDRLVLEMNQLWLAVVFSLLVAWMF